MITTTDLLDAIIELAREKIPGLAKVYYDEEPSNMQRPALLVEPVATSTSGANSKTLRVTEYFTLTVYIQTDDHDRSSTWELLQLRDQVIDLFRCGILRVGTRAVEAEASSAGKDRDRAYVDLQLEFFDVRTEEPDDMPLMETLHTNLQSKKG